MTHSRATKSLALLVLTFCIPPATTHAVGFDSDPFQPFYGPGTSILNVAKTDVLRHEHFSLGVLYHAADGLFRQRRFDGNGNASLVDLIGTSHKLELSAGIGLAGIADIGISIPVVLSQLLAPSADPSLTNGGPSIGDVRLDARVRLLRHEKAAGFGAGIIIGVILPAGRTEALTGDDSPRVHPRLVLDWRMREGGLTIATNLGVMVRPQRRVDDHVSTSAFRWSVGAESPLGIADLRFLASVHGSVAMTETSSPSSLAPDSPPDVYVAPAEVDVALQYTLSQHDLVFTAGGGAGLNTDVGAPAWRVMLGIAWVRGDNDSDGDGVNSPADRCPGQPEDRDGFQDEDGCPDPDNDQDGIGDIDDKCPLVAGTIDRTQGGNGCPEDTDRDGITDADDQCPESREDKDGFQDDDGCPESDNDQDGIVDVDDKCPNDPEDKDGFQDDDGCPESDNDQDGIRDVDDKCPNTPEKFNGKQDEDGCPERRVNPLAQPGPFSISIRDKSYFKGKKASIPKPSRPLLDEIAEVLKRYPIITKLRIDGHTDSQGSAAANLKLSLKRAKAVKAHLVRKGVAPNRLEVVGYGGAKPLEPNKTKSGRIANNRVEFYILEIHGKTRDQHRRSP